MLTFVSGMKTIKKTADEAQVNSTKKKKRMRGKFNSARKYAEL